jgi:hypothetical protein
MSTNDKTVLVKRRQVYGSDMFYPANDLANMVTHLTGHKTLTPYDIDVMKHYGYTVQLIAESETL